MAVVAVRGKDFCLGIQLGVVASNAESICKCSVEEEGEGSESLHYVIDCRTCNWGDLEKRVGDKTER
jgi:hypothetical protein